MTEPPDDVSGRSSSRSPVGVYHGWKVVAVCFAAATAAWGLGLFGASVYLHAVTSATGWSIALVSGAVTLFYAVNAVLLPTVGSVIDRRGPRPVFAAGACALAAGVVGIGFAASPWQLYAAFAIMGIGWASLSTTGISGALAPWFEKRQGKAVSIALMGASAGAILVAPALVFAIERVGLARTGLGAAAAVLAVLLPASILVLRHRAPADLGQHPDGRRPDAAAAAAEPARRWSRAEALRTRQWRTVAIGFALGLAVQVGFLTHHVTLASPSLGTEAAGLLVSATGVAALAGRFFLAAVADRLDARRLAALALTMQILSLATMAALPSDAALIGGSLVFGFAVGQVTTISPIIVRREFGAAGFGAIYGAAATVIQLGLACGPTLFGLLRDTFGDYAPALLAAAVVDAAAVAIVMAGARTATETKSGTPPGTPPGSRAASAVPAPGASAPAAAPRPGVSPGSKSHRRRGSKRR